VTPKWTSHLEPIPILQWLVIIVLAVHVINSGQTVLEVEGLAVFVLVLLGGNALVLHVLPRLIKMQSVASILVVADSLLVPTTLYASGTTRTDVFVVYFGIIMIAASSKSLREALVLTALTCAAYVGFSLFGADESVPLEVVLLRLPFFLVMTLFYGVLSEYAQRERGEKEKLAYAATHDELTGLPNRRFIMESLARQLEESKRFESPLSCAIMDLDKFKQINDTYGHDVGDMVLKQYSALLTEQSRGYDIAGRLGGDEYVWILPRAPAADAQAAGERLRQAVEQFQFDCAGQQLKLSTSIGMTTYLPGEESHPTPSQMLKSADVALYEAKHQGRNRVCHLPLANGALAPAATVAATQDVAGKA
jgi:diguanylate cyclase (GGDEF)-like protein